MLSHLVTYNRVLQRYPGHVQGQFNLAYELKSAKDCNTAVAHFNKVLELSPSYREAHLHLPRCHRILGDETSAEKHEII